LNGPAARELDAAWSAEIEERLAEYDSGAVAAIEAEEVFAKATRPAQ
jgi:putative addiction module component (TIGR02574 family)